MRITMLDDSWDLPGPYDLGGLPGALLMFHAGLRRCMYGICQVCPLKRCEFGRCKCEQIVNAMPFFPQQPHNDRARVAVRVRFFHKFSLYPEVIRARYEQNNMGCFSPSKLFSNAWHIFFTILFFPWLSFSLLLLCYL